MRTEAADKVKCTVQRKYCSIYSICALFCHVCAGNDKQWLTTVSLPYSYTLEAAGAPILEGEVLGEVLSGSSVPLVCSSPGSEDTATLRYYLLI